MAFEMIEDANDSAFNSGTNIKVIGMGGGGGNAVEHMIQCGVKGVEFICANTDAQALKVSSSHRFIQLGKTGLGAGGKPQVGRDAAEQAQSEIRDALAGAHMLFITAGMGGGTGTGAAPVVARIAREMGILTVAVVTKPFEFEGTKRLSNAENGLEELEKHVDSLIIVLNEKLLEVYGDDISQKEAFAKANDVLKNATGGIAEIINVPGMINADFEDVKTVMGEPGKAMMGTAVASGADRARLAAEQAVVCPLLDGVDLSGAKGVLVNITADDSLKLSETREAMNAIRAYAAPDAHIIFGTVNDPTMGDSLRVTVLATGLSRARAAMKAAPALTVLRTGTDSMPMAMGGMQSGKPVDEHQIPAIWRNPRGNAPSAHVNALMQSGMDELEIPAFLRKQAD